MTFERIIQDNSGEIQELKGDKISKFICVQTMNDKLESLSPCLFLLKTFNSNNWHRFFLDANICFWDKYEELPENDLADQENYPWYDLGDKYQLNDLEIISVIITEGNKGTQIRITLSQSRQFDIYTKGIEDDTYIKIK